MTTLAIEAMAQRLTTPFARGASMLTLAFDAGGADETPQAPIHPYSFSDYTALFGVMPAPAYILVALRDIPVATQVTVDYIKEPQNKTHPVPTSHVTLAVPPGTLAGTSFADWHHPDGTLALKDLADPDIQLKGLNMCPAASDENTANWWELKVLLGNLAKLLWVIGWEKNTIRRQLEIVQEQRSLQTAIKSSLDRIGDDLRVPRFPAQPYSLDATTRDTVALYHLDESADVTVVADTIALYPQTGLEPHPGQNNGATSGVTGRFSTAFAFRDTDASAEILIPDHPDFRLGMTDSFTVECFVKPNADRLDKEIRVDHREVIAKHLSPVEGTTKSGWALSIGGFQRGLPLNIRFLLSDGVNQPIMLFADRSLSGDRFYHLAGVIDRADEQARLYIDGILVSAQPLVNSQHSPLGALTNSEPIRIGRTPGAAYRGIIDEVRLSRVARSTFHPVLGEDDDVYRRRLELFRRWLLPTLSRLLQQDQNDLESQIDLEHIVNAAAGPINNDSHPLILDDKNAELTGGTLALTIEPGVLPAEECIDMLGNRGTNEAVVNGTAAAETTFDPVYLVTHEDSRVIYAQPERTAIQGELAPDTHKMQFVVKQCLDHLLDMPGTSGLGTASTLLHIISAFDPEADDLRAVGRGLLLAPAVINASNLAQLAVLAHAAGFTFVCNKFDLNAVYVSTEPEDYLNIVSDPDGKATSADGAILHIHDSLNLGVQPVLPPDTRYRWLLVPCGTGRATITPTEADVPTITLEATETGKLYLHVEVIHHQSVAVGTCILSIDPTPADLADGAAIGDDGAMKVDETIAGTPGDSFFHPVYLITHDDPRGRVTYGSNADINNRRMQPSVAKCLDQLLNLIPNATAAGQQLQVIQAYVPPTTSTPVDLYGVGRALTLSHPTLSPGSLGVMAHAAGFTYVRRQGNQILVRQKPGELLTIHATGLINITGSQELVEGQSQRFMVNPRSVPASIVLMPKTIMPNTAYIANSGSDTISEIDPVSGAVRRALKVGWRPLAVILSPDHKRLYTADNGSNTITAIDVASGNIQGVVAVRPGPIALAHHPSKPRLYVACNADNSLLEIDTTNPAALNILTTLPLAAGATPTDITLTSDGNMLWVALNGAAQLAIISTSPHLGNESGSVALPAIPLKIAIAPDGKHAYVTLPSAGRVAIVDIASRKLLAGPTTNPLEQSRPGALTVAPDNSAVYVTDTTQGNEQIYILNPDGTLIETIRLQERPFDIAVGPVVDADGNTITKAMVVASSDDDLLYMVDLQNDPQRKAVVSTWRLGSGLGEHLSWVLRPGPATEVHLSSTTSAVVTLNANKAGPVLVRALYVLQDQVPPHTFAVKLKPALANDSATVIRKDQYDRIMNVLSVFHPIGVEVITHAIRDRVDIEVITQVTRDGVIKGRNNQLLNFFPNYFYPNFRMRGILPHHVRKD